MGMISCRKSGSISVSRVTMNGLWAIYGWGMIRSGWSNMRSSQKRMSMSMIRGPHFISRVRPSLCSMSWHFFRNSRGTVSLSHIRQAFRKSGCSVRPQAFVFWKVLILVIVEMSRSFSMALFRFWSRLPMFVPRDRMYIMVPPCF
jgi:hypothetical protein